MKMPRHVFPICIWLCAGVGVILACGFDGTLRQYLNARFWQPFSKEPWHFEKENVTRVSVPYAGMEKAVGDSPLAKLRAAYQKISQPVTTPIDLAPLRQLLAAARADGSLTTREGEEVDLIDAKIDMRAGNPAANTDLLQNAETKFNAFLQSASTSEFQSEARGWLARIHFLLGEQTAAGKTYLDELNRNGSNLSRKSLLDSLYLTYGYDGGQDLAAHIDQYFDTPEHAAFAIQMLTNPRNIDLYGPPRPDNSGPTWIRVKELLESHRALLASEEGSNALAVLTMRTALRMGDPAAALQIASMFPRNAPIRDNADFLWILASANYLSHQYGAAEKPLLELFNSPDVTDDQKAAAAYGLCGVYFKTGDPVKQIVYALWLRQQLKEGEPVDDVPTIQNQEIYWAVSGWDLGLLLDSEVPIRDLRDFLRRYPSVPGVELVRYSLAVRLARENHYEEAAQIYASLQSNQQAQRMRDLARLYRAAHQTDLPGPQLQTARYKLAEFLAANPEKIYFNDRLWSGLQRYALSASTDSRLTGAERQSLMQGERKLKDDQEERWRAWLILRGIVHDSGDSETARAAAQLAITCLRRINTERFGRRDEIRNGDIELSKFLLKQQKPPA